MKHHKSKSSNSKFKMNLIGENDNVKFNGSTPGLILTLIFLIMSISIFVNLIINMESGNLDIVK